MSAALVFDIQAVADEKRANRCAEHDSAAARECRQVLDPELSLYRQRTIALLRRYFRMSIELGRLPSVIGREFFRAKISSYRMSSFEDVVILVHDVDRCLGRLELFEQELVARVILQDYSHSEAAVVLHCTRRTVTRRLPEALDLLSKIFLETGLLKPMGEKRPGEKSPRNSCQAL